MKPSSPIPIYVVNLARAAQRRADLSARLAEMGLSAQFPPALDAQDASEAELMDGFVQWGPWGALRTGDIACSQSHRRLWKTFLESGADYALILEDDVVLSDRLPEFCADADWWPDGADIVKIERWKSDRMKIVIGNALATHSDIGLHPLISRHPGGAAYFINGTAARKLLDVTPQTVAIDHLLFNRLTGTLPKGVRVLQSNPALAHQRADGVEQMPATARPDLPKLAIYKQELNRGLRELGFGISALLQIALGRAQLVRLPLAPGMEGAE